MVIVSSIVMDSSVPCERLKPPAVQWMEYATLYVSQWGLRANAVSSVIM